MTRSDCDAKFSYISQVTHQAPHCINRLQYLLDGVSTADCITTTGPYPNFSFISKNTFMIRTLMLTMLMLASLAGDHINSGSDFIWTSILYIHYICQVELPTCNTAWVSYTKMYEWEVLVHMFGELKAAWLGCFIQNQACWLQVHIEHSVHESVINVLILFSARKQKTAKSDASPCIFHPYNPAFLAPTLPECHLPHGSVRLAHFNRDIKWQDSPSKLWLRGLSCSGLDTGEEL